MKKVIDDGGAGIRSRSESPGGDTVNHLSKSVEMEGGIERKKHTTRMPLFEDMERTKGI